MSGQYRRRCADIILPLDQCLVLAEIQSPHNHSAMYITVRDDYDKIK